MDVLVVDDQSNVINGILQGIDWKRIGVRKVYKAFNAFEAKQIFCKYNVDILLCDIEMPVENGLELWTWVRENGYVTECIFLTSHADFIYAQQAISLGGAEYIVQPAPYSEIEEALLRLINKILYKKEKEKYYQYGKAIYSQKGEFLRYIYKKIFTGNIPVDEIIELMNRNGINITEDQSFYQCHVELSQWINPQNYSCNLLCFSIENILEELLVHYGQKAIVYMEELVETELLIYSDSGYSISVESIEKQLGQLIEVLEKLFGVRCVICIKQNVKLSDVEKTYKDLKKQLREAHNSEQKVVWFSENSPQKYQINLPDMRSWEKMVEQGCAMVACQEALEFLCSYVDNNEQELSMLKKFYHEFMKMTYRLATLKSITVDEILEEDEFNPVCVYQDMCAMKHFVQYVFAFFNSTVEKEENQTNQIEQICQYIYEHLDEDIKRADVAEAVFLNPNYVSRLFKNQKGISMKEFIVQEKMKMAKALLKSTILPISVVAQRVGYTNFSYFSQVYKKIYGKTPSEERQVI